MAITGGNITTDGSYTVHTFTADGTLDLDQSIDIEYLIVAGGGAGGGNLGYAGGGGGGGGVITGTTTLSSGANSIVVGAGANLGNFERTVPFDGDNSSAFGLTAIGGGGGGLLNNETSPQVTGVPPNSGGSGGGGGAQIQTRTFPGASGTAGQGFPGGDGQFSNVDANDQSGGGGGGAGEAGFDGGFSRGGNGGDGILWHGSYYGGGGGGGRRFTGLNSIGGLGGGGNGGVDNFGQDGDPNTGGGGGGGGTFAGGDGGSGVVIVRYLTADVGIDAGFTTTPATATALMTEPTIATTIGDNVYITTVIPVSAEMGSVSVFASKNVGLSLDFMVADIELVNNINIDSGTGIEFVPQPMLASADIGNIVSLPRSPMNADASFPDAQAVPDPNYFNLVRQLNPYLYVSDFAIFDFENAGYENGTFTFTPGIEDDDPGSYPLNRINDKVSHYVSPNVDSSLLAYLDFDGVSKSITQVFGTGSFAYELWVRPTSSIADDTRFFIYKNPSLQIVYGENGGPTTNYFIEITIKDTATTTQTLTKNYGATYPFAGDKWYHMVVNVDKVTSNNTVDINLYIDSGIESSFNIPFTYDHTVNTFVSTFIGARVEESDNTLISDIYFDEVAIYDRPLTNSEILDHYTFVTTLSPDNQYNAGNMPATGIMNDASVLVVTNVTIPASLGTAIAEMGVAAFSAGKNINRLAEEMTASSEMAQPSFIGNPDITALAESMTANAELRPVYALNDVYYEYVQSNIAPYRYLTFDDANSLTDYGTDTLYAVPKATFNGTIVNPDLAINGKSAKTLGQDYSTDGVIFLESEYNDDWNTGLDEYHSAFWFKKASEDTSTGLRVLWNLNGAYDNQHVVLFYYQNELFMQFNNASGTYLEQGVVPANDIFDGNRHFVLINFDHTGSNNFVELYIDGQKEMTVDLGQYTGQTINGVNSVSPDLPQNNYPRVSFGSLITPFGDTELPVVPTTYIAYIDEPYWAITPLANSDVANLYNAMPDQTNSVNASVVLEASAENTDVQLSLGIGINAASMTSAAILRKPTTKYGIEVPVEEMIANADIVDTTQGSDINVSADIMLASASFGGGDIRNTVPAEPMTANATIVTYSWPWDVFPATAFPNSVQNPGPLRIYTNIDDDRYPDNPDYNEDRDEYYTFTGYVVHTAETPWTKYLLATNVNTVLPLRKVR